MNEELVKCTGLCRSFEAVQALRGVDLSLTSGKIVGLLGPNGSGKTTLIKILNGLLQPTAGEARIAGLLPGVETKAITSYLPDRGYFPDWMRVGDMIDMFSDFYADFDRAKAEELNAQCFAMLRAHGQKADGIYDAVQKSFFPEA